MPQLAFLVHPVTFSTPPVAPTEKFTPLSAKTCRFAPPDFALNRSFVLPTLTLVPLTVAHANPPKAGQGSQEPSVETVVSSSAVKLAGISGRFCAQQDDAF